MISVMMGIVAPVLPFETAPKERPIGLYRGRVAMHEDWDAPLPPDIAAAFGA